MTIHPIEAESYRILGQRIDLSHWPAGPRTVVERVIHASADVDYAETMIVPDAAVAAGVDAIRAGAPVIADVEMTRVGITGVTAVCYLREVKEAAGSKTHGAGSAKTHGAASAKTHGAASAKTRSAAAMALAVARHPHGAVFVIGCAPTALDELVTLAAAGSLSPALIIGMPVGFVGAAAAKAAASASGLAVITNTGEKGGSAVAAAACNAIVRLAHG